MEYVLEWIFLRVKKPSLFNRFIFFIFMLTQICDGFFTYYGVKIFGMGIEGNPLIVMIMSSLGVGAGLVVAKLVAFLLGILLHKKGFCNTILIITLFYLVVVILPWAYLFFVVLPTLPN